MRRQATVTRKRSRIRIGCSRRAMTAQCAGGIPRSTSASTIAFSSSAVEFIDGETNAVVAEYADQRFGRKYVLNTSQGATQAVSSAATNYLDAYSTWAYAKQAFDQWAAQFRTRLDQINGR